MEDSENSATSMSSSTAPRIMHKASVALTANSRLVLSCTGLHTCCNHTLVLCLHLCSSEQAVRKGRLQAITHELHCYAFQYNKLVQQARSTKSTLAQHGGPASSHAFKAWFQGQGRHTSIYCGPSMDASYSGGTPQKALENKSAHHSNSLVQEGRARRTAKGLQPGCAAGVPARQKCETAVQICPPQGAQGQPSQIQNSAPGLQALLGVRLRSAQAGPVLGFSWQKPGPWGPPHQAAQQQDGARRRSNGNKFCIHATPYPAHIYKAIKLGQVLAPRGDQGYCLGLAFLACTCMRWWCLFLRRGSPTCRTGRSCAMPEACHAAPINQNWWC